MLLSVLLFVLFPNFREACNAIAIQSPGTLSVCHLPICLFVRLVSVKHKSFDSEMDDQGRIMLCVL